MQISNVERMRSRRHKEGRPAKGDKNFRNQRRLERAIKHGELQEDKEMSKKLYIILTIIIIIIVSQNVYAYDENGRWTPKDYEQEYNQKVQNERFDRLENLIRSNGSHRTYRNQGY